jgi:citronellol/citronellal dehydrogenase
VLGLAGELRAQGIAVNALWPRTIIATSALRLLGGDELTQASRTPEIVADAACLVVGKPARTFTGNFLIDDAFLAGEGVTDFDRYRVNPAVSPLPDLFVAPESGGPLR